MQKLVPVVMCIFLVLPGCSTLTGRASEKTNNEFVNAVLSDKLVWANQLIKKGADVNIKGFRNRTLLHMSVMASKHMMSKLLIRNGADVNVYDSNGDTPLHMAALNTNLEIIKLLIEYGADINKRNKFGKTPLYDVISTPLPQKGIISLNNSLDDIPSIFPNRGVISSYYGWRDSLWDSGIDFHLGIDIAAPEGTEIRATAHGIVVKAEMKNGLGNYIKIKHSSGYVTLYAHLKEILTYQGSSVKKGDVIGLVGSTGNTTGPHCHYEIRERGAVINPYPYLHGKTPDEINRDALYNITTLFIKKGAKLNLRSEFDRTLLHEAVAKDFKLAVLLIEKGADINVKDNKGRTPLHEAVRANRINTVIFLLKKGARINARTSAKYKSFDSIVYPAKCTPLTIAHLSGLPSMVKVLKDFGAKE